MGRVELEPMACFEAILKIHCPVLSALIRNEGGVMFSTSDDAKEVIKEAFNDLIAPRSPQQQVCAVEKLVAAASGCEESAKMCIKVLVSALLQLQPKVQLRNKIMKSLPFIGEEFPECYLETVMNVLMCALTYDNNNLSVLVQAISLLVEDSGALLSKYRQREDNKDQTDELNETRENILIELHPRIVQAILKGITLFWSRGFKEASSSIEACAVLQQMQQLMKSTTMYLQQHHTHLSQTAALSPTVSELLYAVLSVVRHSSCPLDLRINCGQLLVVIHCILSQGMLGQLVQHVMTGEKPYNDLTSVAQLALINGILCVTPSKELYITNDETFLGVQVLQAVLTPVLHSNDGSIAVSTIRVIYQWTLRTLEALQFPYSVKELKRVLKFSSPLVSSLLDYFWLAWDHFLDSVKHTTKECFMNLVKILQFIDLENSKLYFLNVCKMFLNQLSSRKYRCSAVSCMVPVVGTQTLLKLYPNLLHELLNYMKDPAMASHAAELLEALFTQHEKEVLPEDWQSIWLNIFIDSFSKEMQTFGYELLFKKLLATSPESLDNAVARLVQCSENPVSEKLCLLIMCVKIGRCSPHWLKNNHSKYNGNDSSLWKCVLPNRIIELCLSHKEESVQTAAFSLLCESPRSTELPEKYEHHLIIDYFTYSITTQSPSYRQHMVKSTKKLLLRIKEGSVAMIKLRKSQDIHSVDAVINEQRLFCTKLFTMMVENINCGANNARRGTALLILQLFHEIILGNCGDILGLTHLCHDHVYIDTLLWVLNDSFETNKSIALRLLFSVSEDNWESIYSVKLFSLLRAASSLASSCKPPESLSAAYLFKFLSKQSEAVKMIEDRLPQGINPQSSREILCIYIMESLEKEVKSAHESLLMAAASGPMYGNLLCLKVLLSDITEPELINSLDFWIQLVQRVLKICYTVSELVAPVVRNSSPEGHLPMDLNPESLAALSATLQASLGNQQLQGDIMLSQDSKCDELVKAQAVSAQMLLLCAWRCIKEVSLILGDLIQQLPLFPSAHAVLTIENVIAIGQYFLTQLSETKHRGAFEQSYIGFSRVCERLWQCEEEQLRKLPEMWLREVLTSIQDNDDTRLCATRRSAGVPFIVQAVLSSEPSVRGAVCLKNTMKILLHLAEESQYDGTDSRIHAFNILRAIYRDTRLGDRVIPYVSTGVKAAIRGYKSTSWAERNSAALLFSALVTRMFGVKQTQDDLNRKNAMSALVFFRRYPDLFEFLKDELKIGAAGVKEKKFVPALFPSLLLLARLSPAPLEGRTSTVSLSSFTPAVLQCAASSVLQLRDLASHAIITLVPPSHLHQVVNQLCKEACLMDQNKLHGILLCLLKLLKSYSSNISSAEKNSVMMNISVISWAATESNPCLVTRGSALELFTFLFTRCLIPKTSLVLKSICLASFSLVSSDDLVSATMPWSALCQRQAAQFLLHWCHSEKSEAINIISTLISSKSYEVRLSALEHIANQSNHSELIIRQLLERMSDIEIHPECLIQIYKIMSKTVCLQVKNNVIQRECLTPLLQHVTSQTKEESRVEIIPALLQFGSTIVSVLLSLKPVVDFKHALNQWLEAALSYSTSEHSSDSRLMVAEGISSIMPFFSSHPSISEGTILEVYESVVTLLQDDCDAVRNSVAYGVQKLLVDQQHQSQCSLQSTRILSKVCDVIGSIGTPEALTLLVKLTLKDDLPQSFGLTQVLYVNSRQNIKLSFIL
nr:thyroid adenoma-associated protein homolog [Cherax quadricarinatus]